MKYIEMNLMIIIIIIMIIIITIMMIVTNICIMEEYAQLEQY